MELKKYLELAPSGAEFVGIRQVREKSAFLQARNGRAENTEFILDQGIMVEVMTGGHVAYAATPSSEPGAIKEAFAKALMLAKAASNYKLYPFNPNKIRPPSQGSFRPPKSDFPNAKEMKGLIDRLITSTDKLKVNEKIINAHSVLMIMDREVQYASSLGASIFQVFPMLAIDGVAIAKAEGPAQKRSSGLQVRQQNWQNINWDGFFQRCETIGKEALELASAPSCPSDERDVILMPDQLYLQIHESIGHPLELDRILGDERNYAGWSFIKPEDFGSLVYGSSLLNVTFDPLVDGEMASYGFDDCGNQASKEYLIKEGRLLRAIGGSESQARSGIPGVANMRSTSWNRPPIDRMANINLLPGKSTLDDMIGNVEKGILMKTNRSWSIDDYRNKFQFGCEYGQLIENGKLTKTVRDPNYRGTTLAFWHSLKAVGNAQTFELSGSPYCGKGEPNQIIRVGHACPPCLFEKIQVFGGMS